MIFQNQSLLNIKLDTGLTLPIDAIVAIKYKKPSGTSGLWVGTIVQATKVSYSVQVGDLDQAGEWRLQAKVTISGRDGFGVPVSLVVHPTL